MVVVHFFENKNNILSQIRKTIPVVGENLKIKGRKGLVANVTNINERNIHVHVILEKAINKKTVIIDQQKKRK